MIGIYKITNNLNNKSYIGQSIHIEKRWEEHLYKSSKSSLIQYVIYKYGKENFTFEILEECLIEELDNKEIFYISLYDTYFNGYNETTGGQGLEKGFNTCLKISKEDLLKIYDLLQNTSTPQKEIAQQFNVGEDVISTINHGKSRRLPNYSYPLRVNYEEHFCCDCGKKLKYYTSIRCDKCNKIQQRVVERPDREKLKDLIRNQSFVQIGKLFGVSDNTIRRWCVYYNLPSKKSDIKLYSDDEWQLI